MEVLTVCKDYVREIPPPKIASYKETRKPVPEMFGESGANLTLGHDGAWRTEGSHPRPLDTRPGPVGHPSREYTNLTLPPTKKTHECFPRYKRRQSS